MAESVQVIPDILEEHLEELHHVFAQRREAICSSDYFGQDIGRLDERIAAHVEGLLLGTEASVPLLEAALGMDDPSLVSAAAYVLSKVGNRAATDSLLQAFMVGPASHRQAICEALCPGSIGTLREGLAGAYRTGSPEIAAVAGEILAYHGMLSGEDDRWTEFFAHEDPSVRRAAWRITAIMGDGGS